MENNWWIQKAEQIQRLVDINDTQKFYEALKAVYGPSHHAVHPVKSKDGNTIIKGILSRWAEHLSELLNCMNSTDPTLVDLTPQFPVIPQLDDHPALHEIQTAIKGLKNNKAAGPDGISGEVFKYGAVLAAGRVCLALMFLPDFMVILARYICYFILIDPVFCSVSSDVTHVWITLSTSLLFDVLYRQY